jgi:halocyanin-like protein
MCVSPSVYATMGGETTGRRRFLAGSGAALATLGAGCTSSGTDDGDDPGPNRGQPADGRTYVDEEPAYGGWFDTVANYQGTVDETDRDRVLVVVGTGRGGLFFDPPAIRVSRGSIVVWEWTGRGGDHSVSHVDDAFSSRRFGERGASFTHAFDEVGVYRYACEVHGSSGQRGAVEVVE